MLEIEPGPHAYSASALPLDYLSTLFKVFKLKTVAHYVVPDGVELVVPASALRS